MTDKVSSQINDIPAQAGQYSVLIVDDEHLARTLLEDYVSKLPMLKLLGSCANAMTAMAAMQQEKIDILLTDIEMPEMTGVEFVENLPYKPSTIFTTAYSQYALEGYDLGVVDYLLKPIPFNRFVKAINKAIERIKLLRAVNDISYQTQPQSHFQSQPQQSSQAQAQSESKPQVAIQSLSVEKQLDYMVVKADRKLYRVKYSDILYVEGQQEYVTFHTKQRNITALYSLKNLEEELPKDLFIRIHRSFIVSINHVEMVDATNVTVAGVVLPIGPSYRDSVLETLSI
jgi:DNA-binding LytR/AlgR family response regulator